MPCDLPCMSYVALYVISIHLIHTDSKTSTHWKLNLEENKVVEVSQLSNQQSLQNDDMYLDILTSTVHLGGKWTKTSQKDVDINGECSERLQLQQIENGNSVGENSADLSNRGTKKSTKKSSSRSFQDETLDCGKSVNSTRYDHLRGIANRNTHPQAPEQQIWLIFKNKYSKNLEVDIEALEKKLKKTKREKPKSVQLYNQLGNYWRIKGDSQKSIECFRRALAVSPNNAEVLHNLARVLFNLKYLDDAIYLTRLSLEVQPPEQNAWMQHFTLGEILKEYGHYQEADKHFSHALELMPHFHPAISALQDIDTESDSAVHLYTFLIIIFLVLVVLLGIISSMDFNFEENCVEVEKNNSRHLHRSISMKNLRLGFGSRSGRRHKQNGQKY